MLGIAVGLLYSNAGEWVLHKYLLHEQGRDRNSAWSFHWHEHHRNARLNEHIDPCYERSLGEWNAQTKELLGLVALGAVHAPLFPVAPLFTGTVWYSIAHYYRAHKRAHREPEWAREHLPWHYDHHMGPNQDANWCVTRPWFDHIMGTREPYRGTEREAKDRARRRARRESTTAHTRA